MHIDEITDLSFIIMPAVVTKDDPLGERAYFGWNTRYRGKKYGNVATLADAPKVIGSERLRTLVLKALGEIDQLQRDLDATPLVEVK
jgi:hypothetical protein